MEVSDAKSRIEFERVRTKIEELGFLIFAANRIRERESL